MFKSVQTAIVQLLSVFFLFICSCTGIQDKKETDNKYSLYILNKDERRFLVETHTLDSGILIPEKAGAEIIGDSLDRDMIVKDGFYYAKDSENPFFSKYRIQEKKLIKVARISANDFFLVNYFWTAADTVLLTGLNKGDFSQAKYKLVNTAEMVVIDSGTMDIPKPSGKYSSISLGFAELHKNKLFVGYTYQQQLSSFNYTTSDTTYLAEMQFPQMKTLKTEKDTRSTYPGGMNTVQPYAFEDEQRNFYFISCPGIALGNRPDLPTGIFRIKAGEEVLDQSYFFNVSSQIHNHAYGIWYLGQQKALVRTERKDLFKGLGDHYSAAHFEFYVIDLSGKVIQKLALPLDKGTRRACVIVEGQKAYIATNSDTAGNYIWIYGINDGTLKKGLQLGGKTNFIMRLDRLH
ncbi:hypothetical protein ACSBL2_15115 [Pedobacter sp. AW31-3R]|uniref:hypothetical protein n=1 Tax=Pedobacter sp. AW31-3R TaxID=3445781 RepID=UPI003F9F360F